MEKDVLVNGGRWEAHLGQQIKLVPDSMPWRTGVRRGELLDPSHSVDVPS